MLLKSGIAVLFWLLIAAHLIMQQVQGADRILGSLLHLRRHHPGRASPPAGPAEILEGKEEKTSCELFIAIPSGLAVCFGRHAVSRLPTMRRGYSPAKAFAIELLETVAQERRASIRDTWGKVVRDDTTVIIVFYLHQDDEDASTVSLVREEQSQYNDIVLIRNEDFGNVLATGQAGVTQRVYLMMQHAQANYDLKLFMKADDDTFVNVPIMLNALRESVKDRFVYIGYPIKKTVQNEGADLAQAWLDDLVDEGDWAPTMSSAYMQGGAYILSKEAVDAIVAVNHATGLRYLRDEDHTVGTWVSPMHLKYLSGDDVGLFFWPWGFQAGYIQEAENYCQEAHQPIGWVHMLKKRDDMLEVFRLAQSCGDIPPSL